MQRQQTFSKSYSWDVTKLSKEECVCLGDPMRAQVGLGPYGISSGQMVKLMFALRASHRVTGVRHTHAHTHVHTFSPIQSFGLFSVVESHESITYSENKLYYKILRHCIGYSGSWQNVKFIHGQNIPMFYVTSKQMSEYEWHINGCHLVTKGMMLFSKAESLPIFINPRYILGLWIFLSKIDILP